MLPPPEAVDGPSASFQDRKTGLVIFGILTALLGVLCALIVPLMFFGQQMAAKAGTPQSMQMIAPAILMYGGLAVVLVWLGIGSAMARRWARALLLIFSWSWLLMGVVGIGMMAFMLPHIMETAHAAAPPGQPPLPESAATIATVVMMVLSGVIFVLLPAAWLLFYRSPHVKATCEAYDPVVRWTDRCPLPVIALCLWLAFSAPMMLLMAVAYKGVMPVFGVFVTGLAGSALYVLIALFWSYAAWALYKLDRRGWWLVAVTMCLFSLSAFITYSRHDISELYVLMGYPAEQIAQIQKFGVFKGQTMAWMTLVGFAPFLGYLLYVRKYFVRS